MLLQNSSIGVLSARLEVIYEPFDPMVKRLFLCKYDVSAIRLTINFSVSRTGDRLQYWDIMFA
jgi:hypothetical protein